MPDINYSPDYLRFKCNSLKINVTQHIFIVQTFAQTFALIIDSEMFAEGGFYTNLCNG